MGQLVVRSSTHIGYKAAQTLYYAVGEQAERIGLPLTHLITLNFSMTSIPPEDASNAFQRLRRSHFNKWATRPRLRAGAAFVPTYAYIFENERDGIPFNVIAPGEPHNVHVHWLAHIPARRLHDLTLRLHGWLDAISEALCPAGTIDIRPIGNSKGLRRYGMKGVQETWAGRFGVTHEPQGLILGRRSGTSTNLGRKARIDLDRQLGIRRSAA
jgi:hypothetical protein